MDTSEGPKGVSLIQVSLYMHKLTHVQRLRHTESDSYPVAFSVFLVRDDWIGELSGRRVSHGKAHPLRAPTSLVLQCRLKCTHGHKSTA